MLWPQLHHAAALHHDAASGACAPIRRLGQFTSIVPAVLKFRRFPAAAPIEAAAKIRCIPNRVRDGIASSL